jgi:hypothetical protein
LNNSNLGVPHSPRSKTHNPHHPELLFERVAKGHMHMVQAGTKQKNMYGLFFFFLDSLILKL